MSNSSDALPSTQELAAAARPYRQKGGGSSRKRDTRVESGAYKQHNFKLEVPRIPNDALAIPIRAPLARRFAHGDWQLELP